MRVVGAPIISLFISLFYAVSFVACRNNDTTTEQPCLNGQLATNPNSTLCECDTNFTGQRCEKKLGCGEKMVLKDSRCLCEKGWKGENCSVGEEQNRYLSACANGNYEPGVDGKCICWRLYTGSECKQSLCQHGTAKSHIYTKTEPKDDSCGCEGDYTGTYCDEHLCSDHGSKHSDDASAPCQCRDEWYGDKCELCNYEIYTDNSDNERCLEYREEETSDDEYNEEDRTDYSSLVAGVIALVLICLLSICRLWCRRRRHLNSHQGDSVVRMTGGTNQMEQDYVAPQAWHGAEPARTAWHPAPDSAYGHQMQTILDSIPDQSETGNRISSPLLGGQSATARGVTDESPPTYQSVADTGMVSVKLDDDEPEIPPPSYDEAIRS